jgi:hypothetical protein
MTHDCRKVNEFRRRSFAGRTTLIAFVCECGDDECSRGVLLTPAEFDKLRRDGTSVLVRGHALIEDAPMRAEADAVAGSSTVAAEVRPLSLE